GGRVVAPPLAAALGVRRPARGSRRGATGLEHLVVLGARLVGARRGAGRRTAGSGLRDARPTLAVERDAQQELARRDAEALELGDRGRGVEPGGGLPAER